MKEQLAATQFDASMSDRVKAVLLVVPKEDTMVIRLPQKGPIKESEERLSQPGRDYPMPPIYECVFRNRPTVDDKLAFHAERTADSTITMCG